MSSISGTEEDRLCNLVLPHVTMCLYGSAHVNGGEGKGGKGGKGVGRVGGETEGYEECV